MGEAQLARWEAMARDRRTRASEAIMLLVAEVRRQRSMIDRILNLRLDVDEERAARRRQLEEG